MENSPSEFTVDSVMLLDKKQTPDAITHLGSKAFGWRLSKESVMTRIERGLANFYVVDQMMKRRIPIKILKDRDGNDFLAAFENDRPWDTLLGLPSCQSLELID